ncbi:MAG: 6-phosphofructokinase, partial [Marinilabiliaceae bacterium]|nr:6-phosphofructokinase [Marinilabiliaceae bacterium]
MSTSSPRPKTIAILTGGGDVPGLNPAIYTLTTRALREGFRVIGIKNGWKGAMSIDPTKDFEFQDYCIELDENIALVAAHSGSTFLHSSRVNPDKVPLADVPSHLTDRYTLPVNDLTEAVIENLRFLEVDYLVPIGGDDSLTFAARLHKQGIKLIGIPKTMDGDVPGTEYCIGFSTCVTRTIELTQAIRSSAGANERLMVIEVFGKNAGFSALLPTVGGAANHCVIPEHPFDMERLTQLMVESHHNSLEKYAVVLVSEGASFEGMQSHYPGQSIGELVSQELKHR